jgi:hypothetical protein
MFHGYAERTQTQREHTLEIRRRFGYLDFNEPRGVFALMRFLYAREWVSAERPGILFDLAITWLVDHHVVLPGITTLEWLVSRIRERVALRVWQHLSAVIEPPLRVRLDGVPILFPSKSTPRMYVEEVTAYWNAQKHPFVWGRRRRHRTLRHSD